MEANHEDVWTYVRFFVVDVRFIEVEAGNCELLCLGSRWPFVCRVRLLAPCLWVRSKKLLKVIIQRSSVRKLCGGFERIDRRKQSLCVLVRSRALLTPVSLASCGRSMRRLLKAHCDGLVIVGRFPVSG